MAQKIWTYQSQVHYYHVEETDGEMATNTTRFHWNMRGMQHWQTTSR